MLALKQRERIAKVKRTGMLYLVQCVNVDSLVVHCWGHLLQYKGTTAKFDVANTNNFRRDEVEITELNMEPEILNVLFQQTRKSPEMQKKICSGDIVVHAPKNQLEARFSNAPASAAKSDKYQCPCHGEWMRMRRGPKGIGHFFSCPTRSETGCNITYSPEGELGDPDKVVNKDDLSDAAE
jgi:hypothetical protein